MTGRNRLQYTRAACRTLVVLLSLAITVPAAADQSAWRLQSALGTPDWLSVSGSYRLRYESLDHTFRIFDPGMDKLLASRLLFHVRASGERFYGGFELQDSRAWLDDMFTPLGTDDVNALEPLRAYVGFRGADVFRPGDRIDMQLGRLTFDVGSRRLIARNRFRNTSNAFTGIHVMWTDPDGMALRTFLTLPVSRLPNSLERGRLRDNEFDLDQERRDQIFWGIELSNVRLPNGFDSEWYLYGLRENDRPSLPTRNRDLVTVGLRLQKNAGPWNFELEAAYQTGDSRGTLLPIVETDLDHRAWFTRIEVGRQFSGRLQPRLVIRYDHASGDKDPDDGRFERFDTLFGARRFEFGPTGIYGMVARSNVHAPAAGLRLQFSPDLGASFDYRAAWLASKRDFLTTAGLRDRDGNSGSFVGHQIDTRLRWALIADSFLLEFGAAYLFKGGFLSTVPNAPPDSDTVYVYLMTDFNF